MAMLINRQFAMPNGDTFSIGCIKEFVERWIDGKGVIVDPFARNSKYGTITNDLNPETEAQYHMEAGEFCAMLANNGTQADVVYFVQGSILW